MLSDEAEIISVKATVTERYDEENKSLSFAIEAEGEVVTEIIYPFSPASTWDFNNYAGILLHNSEVIEEGARPVKLTGKVIGWLLPMAALASNNHSKSESEHFTKIALVAYRFLLNQLTTSPEKLNAIDGKLKLDDIFGNDFSLLIVDQTKIDTTAQINFNRLLPNLFEYGFLPELKTKPYTQLTSQQRENYKDLIQQSFVHINVSSTELDEDRLSFLIGFLSIRSQHSIIWFYCIYQFIEVLIERVAEHETGPLLTEIADCNSDLVTAREKLEEFQLLLKERNRLNLLFTKYTPGVNWDILDDACDNIISGAGWDPKTKADSVAKKIYLIRNHLMHRLSRIDQSTIQDLNQVCEILELLVMQACYKFSGQSHE
ncbi:MAG: hypothetical protein ACPGSB_01445 [Opitutales bacterium]